ncbi:cytochrome c family protein [Nannocystis bainbridge]|uniref:Cytochrome c family protein n=1 Tax=Nannocystis bainbridge TaxID=2995303 RepID=A0ABT5E7F2_9BACT|nr:cytochrome c family protein [Nannocystis bainbridge]MDC0721796.1 cytochrome c family protein [Nannocystis bainbridge]
MSSRPYLLALLGPLACGAGQEPVEPAATPRQPPPAAKQADAKPADAKPLDAKTPDAQSTAAAASAYQCAVPLQLNGTVPPDIYPHNDDRDANCFGWQEFIALNWPTTAGAGFGDPGDTGAVAWQGYMSSQQLFQPDGSPPPPWGTPPTISPDCLAEAGLTAAAARGTIPLNLSTKFSSEFESGDGQQAAPRNAPAWLGDVRGNNVWYEVRVAEDEYDTIVQNQYYNREGQAAYYQKNPGTALALPMGAFQPSSVGALELKAAWMEVPNPSDAQWNRYKLSQAVVVDPATQKCQALTVALVGLHIIHKTQAQPTWVWATFEHVDNAPDAADVAGAASKSWNFYDKSCQPRTVQVPTACQYKGQATVTVGCDANQPPLYWIGDGCPAPTPIQVTRLAAIDSDAQTVNQTAWTTIRATYPDSVWLNYQVVAVQWSTNPPQQSGQPASVPQIFNSPSPDSNLANTVLETYDQRSKCIDCHQYATISGSTSLPSDFSFALQDARPVTAGKPKPLKTAAVQAGYRPTRRIIE